MKLKKSFWLRMLPVFMLIAITMFLSLSVYRGMLEKEKENSWQRLEIATRSTAEKISVRLTDNLNFLSSVSDSFVLTQHLDKTQEVGKYLNSVMEMTIFERIDVILPDGKVITQKGDVVTFGEDFSYEKILEKGTHISGRKVSPFSGKEVLYCVTTVEFEGEVEAILCGTLDCETLSKTFEVSTYTGEAQMFLIDCNDGNYIIDNWRDKFGNIYDMGIREGIDGYDASNMVDDIVNKRERRVAFVSKTNGENSYQYSSPVTGFNWMLCVVVQENIVFEHVAEMQKVLYTVGVAEIILLFLYMIISFMLNIASIKSEAKNRLLEYERATNEAKAKFISHMSHDIRTPLNGIVGMLYIIKNHRDDELMVDDCLDKIDVSTQYLATLANDMLDINEIENNKLILDLEPIDLKELAREIDIMIGPKAKEHKVTYSVDCSELKNQCILGSAVHIKRIMVNLIGNALKYSQDKGKQVWISIKDTSLDKDVATYIFTVSDNGIGMSEQFQQNMFDAFEQEKISARSSYQGYGLGLTIVNRLVKAMDGVIEVESEKGKGSTFRVKLPLKIYKGDMNNVKRNNDEITDLSNMHILIVEDNDFNMEIAEVILTDAGVVVEKAVNGKIATEMFEKSKPYTYDLILMDLMMPEMDGCEATMAIRSMNRPDAKSIPIIAMTASAFEEEIKRCKEAGMNEHISKPLDIEKLISQISKYCKESKGSK